jgi:hypothetical protein
MEMAQCLIYEKNISWEVLGKSCNKSEWKTPFEGWCLAVFASVMWH